MELVHGGAITSVKHYFGVSLNLHLHLGNIVLGATVTAIVTLCFSFMVGAHSKLSMCMPHGVQRLGAVWIAHSNYATSIRNV